jgi:hypothetical protein
MRFKLKGLPREMNLFFKDFPEILLSSRRLSESRKQREFQEGISAKYV